MLIRSWRSITVLPQGNLTMAMFSTSGARHIMFSSQCSCCEKLHHDRYGFFETYVALSVPPYHSRSDLTSSFCRIDICRRSISADTGTPRRSVLIARVCRMCSNPDGPSFTIRSKSDLTTKTGRRANRGRPPFSRIHAARQWNLVFGGCENPNTNRGVKMRL